MLPGLLSPCPGCALTQPRFAAGHSVLAIFILHYFCKSEDPLWISFSKQKTDGSFVEKKKCHKSNFLKVGDTCIDFLILSLFLPSSFLPYFIYLFWPCRLAYGILVPQPLNHQGVSSCLILY